MAAKFFRKGGKFFQARKSRRLKLFLLFDSLHKVLFELRVLKLVVIRFQTGNGWKAL